MVVEKLSTAVGIGELKVLMWPIILLVKVFGMFA